jgi:hypothetical protein
MSENSKPHHLRLRLRDHETGVSVIEALGSEYNEDVAGMLIIDNPAAEAGSGAPTSRDKSLFR